jgi:hypothetical protein
VAGGTAEFVPSALRFVFSTFTEHGVQFTVATDGPEMMRTHLRDELELLLRIGAADEDEPRRQREGARGELRCRRATTPQLGPDEASPHRFPRRYDLGSVA